MHICLILFSWKTYDFNKLRILIIGEDSACLPEPPLRYVIVVYYLLVDCRSRGDATPAGAEELCAVAQKEHREKK